MRSLSPPSPSLLLLGASAAQAEKRIFIIANNADGYKRRPLPRPPARAVRRRRSRLLQSREFASGHVLPPVDKDEITGAIPANAGACKGGSCDRSSRSSARAKARPFSIQQCTSLAGPFARRASAPRAVIAAI
jgi:hypothetical protein